MTASTWKINLEIVAYLLIKVLDLFTSEFEYLVIKVSRKAALFRFCVFFFFKDEKKNGKLFRKICQNFTSRILSRWAYEDMTWCDLLINKLEKATDTKNNQNFQENLTIDFS